MFCLGLGINENIIKVAHNELVKQPYDVYTTSSLTFTPPAALRLHHQQPYVYTTSSCSGRISVFAEPTEVTRAVGKKGGEWVFASHERSDAQEVLMKIKERACSGARLVLRFEPFILHAECESMEAARLLLLAAREAGYRESGITVGGRIMVGIRCSLRLEAPVADAGLLLVPDQYILYLVALANEKFAENEARIAKLEERLLKTAFNRHEPQVQGSRPSQQHTRLQLSLTKATQDPNFIIEATTTNSLSNSSASTLVTGKEASYDLHQGLSPQLKVPLEVALAAAKESGLPGLSGRSRRKQSALLSKSHHFDTVGANLSAAKLPSDRTAVEDLGLPRRLLGKQLNILKRIKAVEKALALRHEADRSRPLATHVKACSAVSTGEQLLTKEDRGGVASSYVSGTMNSMTHKSLPALRPSTATLEAPFIPPQELSQVLATAAVQKAAISAISGEASSSTETSPLYDGQPLNKIIKWHALPLNNQCSVWSTLPEVPHLSGIDSGIDSTGLERGVSPALQDGFFKPLSSPEVLQRWGHASVVHQGRLIVIGGYGGEGSHQRRSDVLLFACGEWMEVTTTGGEGFVPRMGHAAILTGDAGVLVIGGRTSPSDALGDVWRLDLVSWHWQLITPSVIGSQSKQGTQLAGTTQRERPQTWPGRFRHAAVAHEGVVYVFGGRGGDGSSLNDLWALHCSKPASRIEVAATGRTEAAGGGWKWIRLPAGPAASLSAALVNPANPLRNEDILITPDGHDSKVRSSEGSGGDCICWPSPRHSHAVAVLDDVLYLHGGTSEYGQQFSDMYCLKLSEAQRCMETQVSETEEGCLDEPQGSQHGLANAIAVEGLFTEPANMNPRKPLHNSLQWEAVLNNVHSLPNSSSTHPFSSSSLIPSSSPPPSCFSHTLTAWPETGCLLLMGGYPTHEHHNRLYLFHAKSQSWHYIHVAVPPGTSHSHFQGIKTGKQQHKASAASAGTSISSSTVGHALPVFVPVRHTAAILDIPPSCCLVLGEGHHSRVMAQAASGTSPVAEGMDHVTSIIGAGEHVEVMRRSPTTSSPTLMLVGGGAFCFSFGSVFSGVWTLALSQLSLAAFPQLPCPQRTTPAAAPSSTDVNSNTTGSLDLMKSAVLSDLANLDLDLADPSCTWVIQVQSHLAKGVKDAVKDAGWLDKSCSGFEAGSYAGNGVKLSCSITCHEGFALWRRQASHISGHSQHQAYCGP
ncbi:hypothetical protein CEUSTIGMA_g3858.t1 [Chlamydomonas eustigma]|uniref:tRNA(Phe) 7-[(3-amino-3-carboxypropyl)-4-demethylwyosine(37)-N(4)]-methyltransferase n=1 Tax=Chlamydomonas eustigma TaxID=1157962 RepID=A0A250X010_9CHLO|nr:hypothetical protein CEUSTIGMA_g3858.t1 [Chlamydomonas eustigma]|eukprot:GAX76413.1 hypothetical protein CEUSTIGMA_g3858.t1 [Chlamydomonas eustigma]